jgi:hypothetical protein
MKNFTLILLTLCLICDLATAQITFQRGYNFQNQNLIIGSCVQQTTDKGYIVTGTTNSIGYGHDAYLLKTDSMGNVQWSKTMGTCEQNSYFVQETNNGEFIIVGDDDFFPPGYGFLILVNSIGDTIWSKAYRDSIGSSYPLYRVEQTSDGGFIACGNSGMNPCVTSLLVKVNYTGNVSWAKRFGNTLGPSLYINDVQQTTDGGYIISGSKPANIYSFFLSKTDSNGDTLWIKLIGPNFNGNSIHQTFDGGYIIGGVSFSDVTIIKTDSTGNIIWAKAFQQGSYPRELKVFQTFNGEYVAQFQAGTLTYILKIDGNGNVLCSESYHPTTKYLSYDFQQTYDGGFIMVGDDTTHSNPKIILVKTDTNCFSGCNESPYSFSTYNPTFNVHDTVFSVTSININSYSYGIPSTNPVITSDTLCLSTAINQLHGNTNMIDIYPNPASGVVYINFEKETNETVLLNIYNIFGVKIRSELLKQHNTEINVRGLSDGVYFVIIKTLNLIENHKLIIQR